MSWKSDLLDLFVKGAAKLVRNDIGKPKPAKGAEPSKPAEKPKK